MSWMDGGGFVIFQSTLSVRRATIITESKP